MICKKPRIALKALQAKMTAAIIFVVGVMLSPCVEICSAQTPVPWVAGRAPMQGAFPGYAPPIVGPELPGPDMPSEEERLRKWKLQEEEIQRKRIRGFVNTVELEGLEKGHELRVVPKGRRLQTGHVSAVSGDGFILVDSETQQEINILYSEIEAIYVVRSRGESAKRFGEGFGTVLLVVVTLPLTIFGGIIGWDGC